MSSSSSITPFAFECSPDWEGRHKAEDTTRGQYKVNASASLRAELEVIPEDHLLSLRCMDLRFALGADVNTMVESGC